MRHLSDNIIVDRNSLRYLFALLKETKDNIILSEIYSRTYDHMFHYIHPKVSIDSDVFSIVQDVYRNLSISNLATIQEQNLLTFLEHLADRCLFIHSHNSTKSKVYA